MLLNRITNVRICLSEFFFFIRRNENILTFRILIRIKAFADVDLMSFRGCFITFTFLPLSGIPFAVKVQQIIILFRQTLIFPPIFDQLFQN